MNRVLEFMKEAIELEYEAKNLLMLPDIHRFNESLKKWNEHTHSKIMSFGVIKLKKPFDKEWYDRVKKKKPLPPRKLYKLEHYRHTKYRDLYLAYCNKGTCTFIDSICSILFIAEIDGKLRIINESGYDWIEGEEEYKWDGVFFNDFDMKKLGKPIEVCRILEPEYEKHLYEADGINPKDVRKKIGERIREQEKSEEQVEEQETSFEWNDFKTQIQEEKLKIGELELCQYIVKFMEEQKFDIAHEFLLMGYAHYNSMPAFYLQNLGVTYFLVKNDYLSAFEHYLLSTQHGVPLDVTEFNIWEAGEFHYKSMMEGTKTALAQPNEEEGSVTFYDAIYILNKYLEMYPNGKYVDQAKARIEEYQSR